MGVLGIKSLGVYKGLGNQFPGRRRRKQAFARQPEAPDLSRYVR